jgi:SAM-dependent methyltransferase
MRSAFAVDPPASSRCGCMLVLVTSAHRRILRYWDEVGRDAPLEAVLTRPSDAAASSWDVDRFFDTGRADAARFIEQLAARAPSAGRRRALDFGCGVGRVTRALSAHFETVVGVDASRSMIEKARRLNAAYSGCAFVLNRAADLGQFPSAHFDVVYSRLVLQHLPPSSVRRYIPELIRVLAPNGCLMLQLPDVICRDPEDLYRAAPVAGSRWKRAIPAWLVRLYRQYKYRVVLRRSLERMEMFGLSPGEVGALIDRTDGRLVATVPDDSHGLRTPGYEYWVTR